MMKAPLNEQSFRGTSRVVNRLAVAPEKSPLPHRRLKFQEALAQALLDLTLVTLAS